MTAEIYEYVVGDFVGRVIKEDGEHARVVYEVRGNRVEREDFHALVSLAALSVLVLVHGEEIAK